MSPDQELRRFLLGEPDPSHIDEPGGTHPLDGFDTTGWTAAQKQAVFAELMSRMPPFDLEYVVLPRYCKCRWLWAEFTSTLGFTLNRKVAGFSFDEAVLVLNNLDAIMALPKHRRIPALHACVGANVEALPSSSSRRRRTENIVTDRKLVGRKPAVLSHRLWAEVRNLYFACLLDASAMTEICMRTMQQIKDTGVMVPMVQDTIHPYTVPQTAHERRSPMPRFGKSVYERLGETVWCLVYYPGMEVDIACKECSHVRYRLLRDYAGEGDIGKLRNARAGKKEEEEEETSTPKETGPFSAPCYDPRPQRPIPCRTVDMGEFYRTGNIELVVRGPLEPERALGVADLEDEVHLDMGHQEYLARCLKKEEEEEEKLAGPNKEARTTTTTTKKKARDRAAIARQTADVVKKLRNNYDILNEAWTGWREGFNAKNDQALDKPVPELFCNCRVCTSWA